MGANLKSNNSEAKIRGFNSVSGEKLYDFEIISPAKDLQSHPRTPSVYGPVKFITSLLQVFSI